MAELPLKTAVLGLNPEDSALLDALAETRMYRIIAVADKDVEQAQKLGKRFDVPFSDDYRQLVIQHEIDVLFVGAPSWVGHEHIQAAMKKNTHVIKLLPPALNFEQCAELIRTAVKNNVHYFTVNPARLSPAFGRLAEAVRQSGEEPFTLITVECFNYQVPDKFSQRWLSDPQLAGGGVLLRNCFALLDQVIVNFDLPEQVYSLNTNQAPDRRQRLSLTEDTLVLTMKFGDMLMGNLIASRTFGPASNRIRLCQRERVLEVGEDRFAVYDASGALIEEEIYQGDATGATSYAGVFRALALFLHDPTAYKLGFNESADLKTAAVIESAYLSARTGMPESPSRILDLGGLDVKNWPSLIKTIVS